MKTDIERYKLNILIILLIVAYTFMHFSLNGIFVDTTFDKLVTFSVNKPYVYRVLTPWLARCLMPWLNRDESFFLIELISVIGLFFCVYQLFKSTFEQRAALLYALLFFIFLTLTFIVNYRFIIYQPATLYFPYDTPAMLFTTLGLYLSLQKKFTWLYPLMIIATLNRESSVLILMLLPALYYKTDTPWQRPFLVSTILYTLVRLIIMLIFKSHSGDWMELTHHAMHVPHVIKNIAVLLERHAFLWFLAEMAFMPVFWFAVSSYIPKPLRGLRFIALFYIIGLFLVGNILEGRIWGETVALLYFPTMIGVKNWLNDEPVIVPSSLTGKALLLHHAAPIITVISSMLAMLAYFYHIH